MTEGTVESGLSHPECADAVGSSYAPVVPFLKWAGGKRWICKELTARIGPIQGRYIEPFLGSGAVFFSVRPGNAILSDVNRDLVYTYRALKSQHRAVLRHLIDHQISHCSEYYYKVRDNIPSSFAERAARFIYLNRTCWNGLYRVNLDGKFNVPIGTKSTVLLDSDDFETVADCLSRAEITHSDFLTAVDNAKEGDVVFCDPPYTVRHNFNGFVKYNETLFSWSDQVRLRDAVLRARERGARIYVTNADHESIWELYQKDFQIHKFKRYSAIGGAKAVRGTYSEILIEG
jgi:DNA adenine methylase